MPKYGANLGLLIGVVFLMAAAGVAVLTLKGFLGWWGWIVVAALGLFGLASAAK